jgi:hypothetical protein
MMDCGILYLGSATNYVGPDALVWAAERSSTGSLCAPLCPLWLRVFAGRGLPILVSPLFGETKREVSARCLRPGLLLTLVRVKLPLDRRLRVALAGVPRELSVALLADSNHRNVPHPLYDPKIPLRHGTSLPQTSKLSQPVVIALVAMSRAWWFRREFPSRSQTPSWSSRSRPTHRCIQRSPLKQTS